MNLLALQYEYEENANRMASLRKEVKRFGGQRKARANHMLTDLGHRQSHILQTIRLETYK